MSSILERDGLTIEILARLSYRSELGINLKKNLHYFDKNKLIAELKAVTEWYDEFEELYDLPLDYRIKSIQSAILKYDRYYPDSQARKVFDDLLGFRSLCDNYEDVLKLKSISQLRVADMTKGKAMFHFHRVISGTVYLTASDNPFSFASRSAFSRSYLRRI